MKLQVRIEFEVTCWIWVDEHAALVGSYNGKQVCRVLRTHTSTTDPTRVALGHIKRPRT
jgi:hypothetical protein